MIKLIVGKSDHLPEDSSSQIPARGGTHPGRHESHQDAGRHPEERKAGHLPAGRHQVADLKSVHIDPQILIGGSHIAYRRLIEDRIRQLSRHLLHAGNKCLPLFFRHRLKEIEYGHIIRSHAFRQRSLQLLFDLRGHLASGLESGGQHHRARQHIPEFCHVFIGHARFHHISRHIIGIVIFRITVKNRLLFIRRDKQKQPVHLFHGDLFRHLVLHAALLDAHIDDVRRVGRQRQITVRLDKQHGDDQKERLPVLRRILK